MGKRVSKKIKVQTPEMGVVNDLVNHGKKLIKKHGKTAVEKVGKHLESYAHQAVSAGVDAGVGKLKKSLPALLHKNIDSGGNVLKEFGRKQATNQITRGVSTVTGAVNKK